MTLERMTADVVLDPARRVDPTFFARPVVSLARALVGTLLIHRSDAGITAGRIVETEAYRGPRDLAAHSRGGLRTQRTEAMFGGAGTVYMFLLYGTSWAFNIVAGEIGEPHAVLVRALEPLVGLELMSERRRANTMLRRPNASMEAREPGPRAIRASAKNAWSLTNGPGKLCQAMGLDRTHYGATLGGPNLYLAHGTVGRIGRSPRINIDYAGDWAQKPWRFVELGNPWLSVKPRIRR